MVNYIALGTSAKEKKRTKEKETNNWDGNYNFRKSKISSEESNFTAKVNFEERPKGGMI